MTDAEFRRGVLLGLRSSGRKRFNSSDSKFHMAFQAALIYARRMTETESVARSMLENFDPVFGVYEDASTMILEGCRDLIVTLDHPAMTHARFKLDEQEAAMLLLTMSFGGTLANIGDKMNQELPA